MNEDPSIKENMEETQDQDVSLRIQTDSQEEEVGHNTHQIEEDDLDTVHVESQKEDLPIDFGGIQKEAYLQSLARMSTKVKFLTNWTRGELEQFEASLQQLHSRGANPQVIDLIDESLHKSLLTGRRRRMSTTSSMNSVWHGLKLENYM